MTNIKLSVIILAAGKGKRMHSSLPKILHAIAGKAIVQHIIDTSTKLNPARIHVVYGHGGDRLQKILTNIDNKKIQLNWIQQVEASGTGHAVQQVLPSLKDDEQVLILYGDIPLISPNTLQRLIDAYPTGGISLLTVILTNPDGYGRIIRYNGAVVGIVEQQDANEQQQAINEINTGIMVASSADLKCWLSHINNKNAQGEFYLTDIIRIAVLEKRTINTVQPDRISEIYGVNNRLQLARLERIYQKEQAEDLLLAGVMLSDPTRFDLRGELLHGQDVFIDTNVIIEGRVTIGNRVLVGTGCFLKNAIIGDDVVIRPYTLIEDALLDAQSSVGPFAHLRPGSELEQGAHVGNFVEMKNARLGKGSKAGHLSYLGDASIGSSVNIGAGTITCNYDGVNKNHTCVGNDVFIGSDSQLIAPVKIGNGATIGAGTTVTKDVLEGEMIISRIRQFSLKKN